MSELPDTWQDWFDQYAPALVLLARGWVDCHTDAEEAVQEAFVRFWKSGRRRAKDPKAYPFTCVKHAALDLARKAQRRRKREEKSRENRPPQESVFACPLEKDERGERIESAISRLPNEQREVLVMKIWGELTFLEIATALEISPNTAASRYRYALTALRKQLSEEPIR